MTKIYHQVPIGRIVFSSNIDDVLVVYGLGSCVAVCLYDPYLHMGALLHALLPTNAHRAKGNSRGLPTKYVDRGIPLLVESLLSAGAKRARLLTYLCGGAKLITVPEYQAALNIGRRNVEMAQATLQQERLHIQAQLVGGQTGRTVKFHIADGRVMVKTLRQAEQAL